MQEINPVSGFYCLPAGKEELREIVDRSVAHGAKINCLKSISEVAVNGAWVWGRYPVCGVADGVSIISTIDPFRAYFLDKITIEQLREAAPLVSELSENELFFARFYSEHHDAMTNWGGVCISLVFRPPRPVLFWDAGR